MSGPLTRDRAIDELAQKLFLVEERFLPEGEQWDTLTETDRELYRALVRELLLWRELVLTALG
jgi:hypothetical protein